MSNFMCQICSEIVDKEHFDTEEHINKFNSACKIKIDKSLEDSFITIKCKFTDTRYNYIYTYLYFKKYIREIILKNIDTNKYHKSYIIKKNVLEFNQGKKDPMYISEKHDSNDVLYDIQNIEHLKENKERNLKPYLIKYSSIEYDYKIKKMYEDIEKVNFKESGNSIYYINSAGCEIFITECQLLKDSNHNFENIPKTYFSSRVINVIKKKMEIFHLLLHKKLKKIKMMTLIFDGILLLPGQQINIHDIESYLFDKTNIPMIISIKPFKDYYEKFGEPNINIKEFTKKYKNICYIN